MARSQIDFKCLVVEKNSLMFVCATKVRLSKLQNAHHKQNADQPNPTCTQEAIYQANKQAKEEVDLK